VDWESAGDTTTVTRSGLSLTNGVTYYFLVYAESNAGLESAIVSSDGAVSDITPPSSSFVVRDGTSPVTDIIYNTITTHLSANWDASADAESGIARYRFAISSTVEGGSEFLGWQDNGLNKSTMVAGLSLENGVTYYFAVKAENNAGLKSTVSSDGVVPDTTQPLPPANVWDGTVPGIDIESFSSTTTISATWNAATDSESGIAEYWFAVGKSSFTMEETGGWKSAGNNKSTTTTGLSLSTSTEITYYFLIKAKNNVGLESASASSNGQVVDLTKPTIDSLFSATHPNQNDWYSSTLISYTWVGNINFGYGDLAYYYLQDNMEARTTGYIRINGSSTTETSCAQTIGTEGTWFFHLIAENTISKKLSNVSNYKTQIDISPPSAVTTVNDGLGVDIKWVGSTTTLSANWTASEDTLSGITTYWFAVGTSSSLPDVASWESAGDTTTFTKTGLSLTGGTTYYFLVKAENGAGLKSAVVSSDGQIVDVSEPVINFLASGTHADQSKWYSSPSVSYAWSGSAPSGGLVFYYLLSSATVSAGNIQANGSSTTETSCAQTAGTEGIRFFNLIVKSKAGNLSEVKNYKTQIDTSPPTAVSMVNDGTEADIDWSGSSTTLSANWSASTDTESGIAAYWYAIGSSSFTGDIVDWTSAGNTTAVTKTGLFSVGTYYFLIKAENNAGLKSAPVSSNGQIVDVDKPAVSSLPAKNIGVGVSDFPEIRFSEKLSTVNINQLVSLEIIRDNLGVSKVDVSGSVSCGANMNEIKFTPDEGKLKNNYLYRLKISSSVSDIYGNKLGEVININFLTLMDHEERNLVYASFDENEKVYADLPANTFSENAYVIVSTKEINNSIPKLSPADDTFCALVPSSGREFLAYNTAGSTIAVNTGSRIAVTLAYENLPVNIDTETLNVWYLDEDRNVLIKLPGSSIDTVNKTVSADVYHFSSFVLAGESNTNLRGAYAYPVPYKPFDGVTETGNEASGITFTNLGSKATIKIYTLSGELVKTLYYQYSSGEFEKNWCPVVNEDNEKVASGLYIYYIANGVEKKHGNLIIVR